MLDEKSRVAILELCNRGHAIRYIARTMGISRTAVRKVVENGSSQAPRIIRAEKGEPYRDDILELLARCKGNIVRVHERLVEAGADLSYQALTAFCHRHGIGHEPKVPAGRYHFSPGEEMGLGSGLQSCKLVHCPRRRLVVEARVPEPPRNDGG